MKITTKLSYLQAAVIHTAVQDIRFYLCGVYIHTGNIVATDGHRAIIINDDEIECEGHIIPRQAIISLAKKAKKGDVTIESKDDGFGLMSCNGEYEYFKFIDGKFPDYRRVDVPEPKEPLAEWLWFNSDYLKDFKKSKQILTGNKMAEPIMKPTGGNNVIYITLTDNAHGVLMPMRQ